MLANTSDNTPLVFIDFDVRASKIDIVTFPDTRKMWMAGAHTKVMADIPETE